MSALSPWKLLSAAVTDRKNKCREEERGEKIRQGLTERTEKGMRGWLRPESMVLREETASVKAECGLYICSSLHPPLLCLLYLSIYLSISLSFSLPLSLSLSLSLSLCVARRKFEHNVRWQCETMKNNSCIQSCYHSPLLLFILLLLLILSLNSTDKSGLDIIVSFIPTSPLPLGPVCPEGSVKSVRVCKCKRVCAHMCDDPSVWM